jgi:hypothetical protein
MVLFTSNLERITGLAVKNKLSLNTKEVTLPHGCVQVFGDCNYGGDAKTICSNTLDMHLLGWNDAIASIKIGENTRAELFTDSLYMGSKREVRADNDCLHGFLDQTTSLKIFKE